MSDSPSDDMDAYADIYSDMYGEVMVTLTLPASVVEALRLALQ